MFFSVDIDLCFQCITQLSLLSVQLLLASLQVVPHATLVNRWFCFCGRWRIPWIRAKVVSQRAGSADRQRHSCLHQRILGLQRETGLGSLSWHIFMMTWIYHTSVSSRVRDFDYLTHSKCLEMWLILFSVFSRIFATGCRRYDRYAPNLNSWFWIRIFGAKWIFCDLFILRNYDDTKC